MRLTIQTFLTLDGVLQAPGGPDEDPEGHFRHGGWSYPYGDEDFGKTVDGWFANVDSFLLGRKTYDIFAGFWPKVTNEENPVASKLNALPKYVASKTLTSADWHNTTILSGDVVAEVRKLKEQPGGELQVHGSGDLAQTLIAHDLIDEYRLFFYPVVLGSGKKLFNDSEKASALRLISSTTTSTGVIIAAYEPAGAATYGAYTLEDQG